MSNLIVVTLESTTSLRVDFPLTTASQKSPARGWVRDSLFGFCPRRY